MNKIKARKPLKVVKNVKVLDEIIGEWIRGREMEEVVNVLNESGAVVGPMYDVSQIYEDPHYKYRETFVKIDDKDLGEMRIPNVFAKFSRTPGKIRSTGPDLGQHNEDVYGNLFGYSSEKIKELEDKNII